MSVKLMAAVFDLEPERISPTDALVLLALADGAGDEDTTWLPIERRAKKPQFRPDGKPKLDLRRKTKLGVRSIQGALRRLEADGHLTRVERPGKGVVYTIHPVPDVALAVNERGAGDAGRTNGGAQDMTPRGAVDAPKTSVTVTDLGGCAPEGADRLVSLPVQPGFIAKWIEFVAMRKAQKKPVNRTAVSKLFGTLVRLEREGHDPGEVVDQSTVNCWQGFWPIKEYHDPRANHHHAGPAGGDSNAMARAAARAVRGEADRGGSGSA